MHPIARPSRHFGLVAGLAAMALLSACAQPFEARVQSFQTMPPNQGQTFTVKPAVEAHQGSLEFGSYAAIVAGELQKHGYRQVAAGQPADLNVLIDFGAGPGRERIATRPGMGPMWGGSWGWYGRRWGNPGFWGSFYDPFWGGGPWSEPEVYSFTVYPSYLEVDIHRAADNSPLFEGRAETTTRVNNLPAVLRKLAEALFNGFPGEPAQSRVVRVPTK